jgi:flagellar protein FlbD
LAFADLCREDLWCAHGIVVFPLLFEEYMIQLTRLNNKAIMVNSDLIKFVEQSPDTLVTLINGEKIVVREDAQQVLARIIEFRRAVLAGLPLTWGPTATSSLERSQENGEPSER